MAEGTAVGQRRSALDMMIAAVAETNHCVVVTDNERDFAGIKIINPTDRHLSFAAPLSAQKTSVSMRNRIRHRVVKLQIALRHHRREPCNGLVPRLPLSLNRLAWSAAVSPATPPSALCASNAKY